jgi:hypothetical protein
LLPLVAEVLDSLSEPDTPASVTSDSVKNFIDARSLGESLEFPGEVLLERLATLLSSALQGGMDCVRHVPDEKVWHAFIMQARGALRQGLPDATSSARDRHVGGTR